MHQMARTRTRRRSTPEPEELEDDAVDALDEEELEDLDDLEDLDALDDEDEEEEDDGDDEDDADEDEEDEEEDDEEDEEPEPPKPARKPRTRKSKTKAEPEPEPEPEEDEEEPESVTDDYAEVLHTIELTHGGAAIGHVVISIVPVPDDGAPETKQKAPVARRTRSTRKAAAKPAKTAAKPKATKKAPAKKGKTNRGGTRAPLPKGRYGADGIAKVAKVPTWRVWRYLEKHEVPKNAKLGRYAFTKNQVQQHAKKLKAELKK